MRGITPDSSLNNLNPLIFKLLWMYVLSPEIYASGVNVRGVNNVYSIKASFFRVGSIYIKAVPPCCSTLKSIKVPFLSSKQSSSVSIVHPLKCIRSDALFVFLSGENNFVELKI